MEHAFTIYDVATGRIECVGSGSFRQEQTEIERLMPGKSLVSEAAGDQIAFYVRAGEIVPRPELRVEASKAVLLADGKDEVVLTGFPTPCTVSVDGRDVELQSDGLTLTADTPATYRIECKRWPFVDWAYELEAKEPGA